MQRYLSSIMDNVPQVEPINAKTRSHSIGVRACSSMDLCARICSIQSILCGFFPNIHRSLWITTRKHQLIFGRLQQQQDQHGTAVSNLTCTEFWVVYITVHNVDSFLASEQYCAYVCRCVYVCLHLSSIIKCLPSSEGGGTLHRVINVSVWYSGSQLTF